MKSPLPFLITVALFFCVNCIYTKQLIAQSANNPLYFYLDNNYKETKNAKSVAFIEAVWKDAGQWRAQMMTFPGKVLVKDFSYTDSTRTQKQGRVLSFHFNGNQSDSGFYVADKLHGDYFSWYDDGNIESEFHYNMGNPVDTCLKWSPGGTLNYISITDSNGNGLCRELYSSGKSKFSGRLFQGKQHGLWQAKSETGVVKMQVQFTNGEIQSTACFNPDGSVKIGYCVFEKLASFPGGAEAWRLFLQQNLQYPSDAQTRKITGAVKVAFNVAKDGKLDSFVILSSPDKSLSDEVLRLMKLSPTWVPALQYNEPVIYRHIQSISFYLE